MMSEAPPEAVLFTGPYPQFTRACSAARQWLSSHGVNFEEVDVTRDPQAMAQLQAAIGGLLLPVLYTGTQTLSGFDPFMYARALPKASLAIPPGGSEGLGLAGQDLTEAAAAEMGLPCRFGVLVGAVKEGGVAEAAGLLPGDVITGIGSYSLLGLEQLKMAVTGRQPGDEILLKVWRDGNDVNLTVGYPSQGGPVAQAG